MVSGIDVDLERLPGVDPAWSRFVEAAGARWHVLDNAAHLAGAARGPVLAVHGNPTWSYLWRGLLRPLAGAGWRVVAVDQLGMGLSRRRAAHDGPWRLADRVAGLGAVTDALGLTGPDRDGAPVVALGHDWGGIVAAGWAIDHPDELGGLVLTNTAVHHDGIAGEVPALLRLARHRAVHSLATVTTPAFLEATLALSTPALPAEVKDAYRAPYRDAAARASIGDFVEDIPVSTGHPSFAELRRVADGLARLGRAGAAGQRGSVPVLLVRGPRDVVFYERFHRDLMARLPHADVHRVEGAGHLVVEDAADPDLAEVLISWLDRRVAVTAPAGAAAPAGASPGPEADAAVARAHARPFAPLWRALDDNAGLTSTALATCGQRGVRRTSWRDLSRDVRHLALALADAGVRPGDRVSLLVTPGVELTTALFACLRIGAVVVLADAGLGTAGLTRVTRGAAPSLVLGIPRALAGGTLLRWPGRRVLVVPGATTMDDEVSALPAGALGVTAQAWAATALDVESTYLALLARGAELAAAGAELPPEPGPGDDAAVLFTSGSTGPAKGVVYTHERLSGMRDVVRDTYDLAPDRGLVAGFAPFALLGTAVGASSSVPDMDVTSPGTLTAAALAEAVGAIDAHAVFLAPAALDNVVRTQDALTVTEREALDTVAVSLTAGAPVSSARLARLGEVLRGAELHTPYGMTEALPLTDVTLEEVRQAEADAASGSTAGAGGGTCVGRPVAGASLRIVPLDDLGRPTGEPLDPERDAAAVGVTGEVLATAANLKDRYDRLFGVEARSARWPGWHRTGDVGHLDAAGRLWIEGRLAHVIATADGPVTPVTPENAVLGTPGVPGVRRAAAVGVGPRGAQQMVIVVETDPAFDAGARRRASLATPGLARAVRRTVAARSAVPVAAVLRVPEIPTDVRHNSKVERAALAAWAERALAGGRMVNP